MWQLVLICRIYGANIPKNTVYLLPKLERLSQGLGQRIKAARLRRQVSSTLFAERLGVSRNTLIRLELGDASVSLGTYIKALSILGLEQGIAVIADDDKLGRVLQDARDARPSVSRAKINAQNAQSVLDDGDAGVSMSDMIRKKNNQLIAEILSKPTKKGAH
jgi:transcriptional regulator with XRE-family HTH domain